MAREMKMSWLKRINTPKWDGTPRGSGCFNGRPKPPKARLYHTTGPDLIRPKKANGKKAGSWVLDEGGVLIHLLLENSKCSGTVKTIYKEHNRW